MMQNGCNMPTSTMRENVHQRFSGLDKLVSETFSEDSRGQATQPGQISIWPESEFYTMSHPDE